MSNKKELGDPRDRVREFIRHRLAGMNGRQAAIAAGYSPASAAARAWQLSKDPLVIEALAHESRARDQLLRHTPAGIEAALGYQGFADPALMFNPDGSLKPIAEMPPQIRAAISGFEHHSFDGPNGMKHKISKLKLAPRHPSLETIAKLQGMLQEQPAMQMGLNINLHLGPPPQGYNAAPGSGLRPPSPGFEPNADAPLDVEFTPMPAVQPAAPPQPAPPSPGPSFPAPWEVREAGADKAAAEEARRLADIERQLEVDRAQGQRELDALRRRQGRPPFGRLN